VEGTAVLGRLSWRVVSIAEIRSETPQAKTLVMDVPGWPGHAAGQHVDIRLTAEDGYQAQRSYSIASPPDASALELTIERIGDGEVSPYLTDEARVGDEFELRGPIGGYFVWDGSDPRPVLLVAGGSGLVPLMAMIRHHQAIGSRAEMRLLLSARTIDDVLYRDELGGLSAPVAVTTTLTRGEPPPGWTGFTRRIDREMLDAVGAAVDGPVYVCGPTPFVEEAARLLVEMGREPADVFTERFGPTGGADG
jgi:ferredoxin-NADP reductase